MFNRSGFAFYGESITGLVRRHNEDNFLIAAPLPRRSALAVVADGVGGHRQGEVASYIVCREMGRLFFDTPDSQLTEQEGTERFLRESLQSISSWIFQCNFNDRNPNPMSTTVVAAILTPEFVAMINVGDSRFYRISAGGIVEKLSVDHTLAGDPEMQNMREKFPNVHPNAITRSVGSRRKIQPHVAVKENRKGDRFFLCSDGVYHQLGDEAMEALLADSSLTPRSAVGKAIRQVLLGGGRDNATAISCCPCILE